MIRPVLPNRSLGVVKKNNKNKKEDRILSQKGTQNKHEKKMRSRTTLGPPKREGPLANTGSGAGGALGLHLYGNISDTVP